MFVCARVRARVCVYASQSLSIASTRRKSIGCVTLRRGGLTRE